jgi:FkbM family methyltransferase
MTALREKSSETKSMPAWVSLSRKGIRLMPRGRYVLMNWLCRHPSTPFYSTLEIAGDGVRFICDLQDGIAREACFMGHYEPQETVLVKNILSPGMIFVDVGANWGYFTLLAASLVGSRGRVVSFEPHPILHDLLARNVRRNNFHWVTPLRIAVADTEGVMNLAGYVETDANHGISRLTTEEASHSPNYSVPTGVLESLLQSQGIGQVDLLKMDIEGAEALVLPTMKDDLARGLYKRILLELHPAALKHEGLRPKTFINEMLGFGYRAWRLDHSQAAFWRASYHLPCSPKEFLVPYNSSSELDTWPHFLFLAPDVEPSW